MTVANNKWTPTHRCTFKPNPRKKEKTKKDTKYAPTQNNTHRHSHTHMLSNTHTHAHTKTHTHTHTDQWGVDAAVVILFLRLAEDTRDVAEHMALMEKLVVRLSKAHAVTLHRHALEAEKRWLMWHSYSYFFQHRTFPMLQNLGHLFPRKVTSVILKTMLVSQIRLQ